MRKKLLSLLGLWMLILLMTGMNASAAAPKMDAAITKDNILGLLKVYDSDGAYILQSSISSGDNILQWWAGENSITSAIETAVHEECHGYSFRKAPYKSEDIYTGNKNYIRVKYTNVYQSKKMANSIPSELRTFRWSTYVGNPVPNLASDIYGAYGLLNEFTAYYWGMNTQMSLFPYYRDYDATPEQWLGFLSACANNRLAYAEFKYYILHYLVYAKKHYPAVYKGIISNKNFINAYTKIEKNFAKLNTEFASLIGDISVVLQSQGYQTYYSGDFYNIYRSGFGTGTSLFQNDYEKLLNEISKPKYQKILTNSSTSAKVGKTSLKQLKVLDNGIKISWKKASGASGYYVYRKAGNGKFKKVKTTSATSWTDTEVKTSTLYSYYVIPYKKDQGQTVNGTASASKSAAWMKAPTISSVKSTGKAMQVKWSKVSKASGYEIRYATNKKFKKATTIKVKGAAAKKISSLKKNKLYYVQIRSYWNKSGSTYYSSWSGMKQIKI